MEKEHVILCVDDEINILKSLERTLRTEGYKIITATSGEEGIQILENNSVDLVIVDERMPAMSGSEFLKIIKKKHPSIISIMISGYSNFNSLVKAVNEGEIFRFIPKPWDTNKMREVVRLAFTQERLKHVVDDSTKMVDQIPNFPAGIRLITTEEQNSVNLKIIDHDQNFCNKFVPALLNCILDSLGVAQEKKVEICSGAIEKMQKIIIFTVNVGDGINIKIELPRSEESEN